jgi:hypothetical protein
MNTALTVAILAASVTALGWLVTHILSTSAERRRQNLLAQLEFTKQQLEELYGPLAFLVLEGQQSFRDLIATLGRNFIFVEGYDLPENELSLWLFWVENDFFPRNEKIKALISSKTHLIEGEKVPESFLTVVERHNSWMMMHKRWQQQGVKYPWYAKVRWPTEFNKEILATFEILKKRHSILTGKVSEGNYLLHLFQRNRA